mgnify:CR=1 FL=1
MKSSFLTLNGKDFFKGLFVAVITAVITIMYSTIEAGSLVFDWKAIGTSALTAGLAYIMKNLVTNSNDELFKSEPKATE